MAVFKVIGCGEDGKYMDVDCRKDVIGYCLQAAKTTHGFIGGMSVNPENAAAEMSILAGLYYQERGLRLRHWIISFDESEISDPQIADQFARRTIPYYGSTYQIIYAVHEDTDQIHIHFVMNMISYQDGRRYRGVKKDYYDYLRILNEIAASYGFSVIPMKN